ncbi:MAG: cyclic nucleotide-binding domain-containing protein [Chloroflexi bacterium CFX4]|jgi:CRP-like cAMP-binding protein|nr:cyclic nucleotide-binding domain-containing protein [Chloroflexi bacterium CFX4]MDL1921168.1 cyclic nucleotide-binding domain-containing protein [Chloroflexi bacterium CFX3]
MSVTTNLFRHVDQTEEFSAGQSIFSEGEYGAVMYVVLDGEVNLIDHSGSITEVVMPGGMFGEMALIDAKPRSLSAVARTNCKLAAVDRQRFSFMVTETPYFALHVMQVMAERLRRRGG